MSVQRIPLATLFGSALFCSLALGMDLARKETGVDQAVSEFKVTGKGVLVAIMDRGIDWGNSDFRNPDGTSRIEYIFDLTDDGGAKAAENTYKMGTIYTKNEINEALKKRIQLTTRDAVGHGTTTAGIACGNGQNSPGLKYRGIAPDASLLVVKITGGAPAHGDQPAEANFYRAERLPVAIDFIRDKSKELGMPCVMCLNIGSQGGPTDGSSELCRKIDATVGPAIPGLIFVTGPGDDGGRANRAGGTIKQDTSVMLKVKKETKTPIRVELWYSDTDRLDVSVHTPSGKFGPYPAPTKDKERQTANEKEFVFHHNAGNARFYRPENKKREVFVELTGPVGDYALVLHGKTVENGRFDATLGPNPPAANLAPFNRFLNYVAPGSIWDGATAHHNICPGDYVIRTHWKDIDGKSRSQADQGKVGELWTGSSTGPTFDGRPGVDFCVPGDSLFTTYNPRSHWATFRFNLVHDGKGLYGRASAVSAANPFATGVIALMLELDPRLDAVTAKQILQKSARSDQFTGNTPNPSWGYGKLDVQAALTLTKQNADKRKP
jgi:minor extracellular serine protease Vpr